MTQYPLIIAETGRWFLILKEGKQLSPLKTDCLQLNNFASTMFFPVASCTSEERKREAFYKRRRGDNWICVNMLGREGKWRCVRPRNRTQGRTQQAVIRLTWTKMRSYPVCKLQIKITPKVRRGNARSWDSWFSITFQERQSQREGGCARGAGEGSGDVTSPRPLWTTSKPEAFLSPEKFQVKNRVQKAFENRGDGHVCAR